MSQLIDNLNTIESVKTDIKSAIENKGVDMTGVSFPGYASKIGEISGGGTFVTETLNVSVNNTYYPGQGVDGFSQVVVDVPQSVTGFTEKEITEGIQIVNLSNSASYVSPNVFANNVYIQTVNLPNCIEVGSSAFQNCTNLSSIYLPNCVSIGSSAFKSTGITSVDLPNCETLNEYVFVNCYQLSSLSLPNCTHIYGYTFSNCSSLTSVDLPKCEFLSNAFLRCS